MGNQKAKNNTDYSKESLKDKKVWELVNQYYYDICSSKVVFNGIRESHDIHEKNEFYEILFIYIFVFICLIIEWLFKTRNLEQVYWMISLSGVWFIFFWLWWNKRTIEILKEKYSIRFSSNRNIREVQEKWIQVNLGNINKKTLLDICVERHKINKQFKYDEFRSFKSIKPISVFFIKQVVVVILSITSLYFFGDKLGNIIIPEMSDTLLKGLLIGIYLVLIIIGLVYIIELSIRPLLQRFFAKLDRSRSLNEYRFNFFVSMLSSHIQIGELLEEKEGS